MDLGPTRHLGWQCIAECSGQFHGILAHQPHGQRPVSWEIGQKRLGKSWTRVWPCCMITWFARLCQPHPDRYDMVKKCYRLLAKSEWMNKIVSLPTIVWLHGQLLPYRGSNSVIRMPTPPLLVQSWNAHWRENGLACPYAREDEGFSPNCHPCTICDWRGSAQMVYLCLVITARSIYYEGSSDPRTTLGPFF